MIIRKGTYQGGLIVQLEGTEEAPILIQGESLDAAITGTEANRDALRLDHSSYVTIDRLTARDATRAGIGIIHSHHITVTNCRLADNGLWGIFTGFADDVRFEGNECYGSKKEHGIYHSNSGDQLENPSRKRSSACAWLKHPFWIQNLSACLLLPVMA